MTNYGTRKNTIYGALYSTPYLGENCIIDNQLIITIFMLILPVENPSVYQGKQRYNLVIKSLHFTSSLANF